MELKIISREEIEEAVSKYDCHNETYSSELREDIIKDIQFGAELQLEKILEDLQTFVKKSIYEFKKSQKEREREIEKKMRKSS